MRCEVARMADALLGMRADLGSRLLEVAFATDAQGAGEGDHGGYGVVGTPITSALARELWVAGCRPGYTVISLDGDMSKLRRPEKAFARRIPFSRAPWEIVRRPQDDWTELATGRWRWADHNTLGEGRATLVLQNATACCPTLRRTKIMSFEDNSSWGGAAAKGRSPSVPLNYLCRRRCALSLGADQLVVLPWLETSRMSADESSRRVAQ